MEKIAKYVLTDETIKIGSTVLYRIKALIDFYNVKAGDLGGFVESETNLSHEGKCWVYNDACVYDNAKVYGNAQIMSNVHISGNAKVYEDAKVYENAIICGDAEIYGYAKLVFLAKLYDYNIAKFGKIS